MKTRLLAAVSAVSLLCPALSFGNILSDLMNPSPSVGSLAIAYTAIQDVYDKAALYYKEHSNHCAPPNTFLKQPSLGNLIDSITNDSRCAIVLHFSQNAPGPLQGKYIAQLPQKNGDKVDFDFPRRVTDVDFGPRKQSLFSQPQKPFAWSPTLQSSSFGNVPSTSQNNVLMITYSQLASSEQSANASSSSSSSSSSTGISGSQGTANIISV